MSERKDIHTALGLILRRMNELADEIGKPDAQGKKALKEVESLNAKWRELMDRLNPFPSRSPDSETNQAKRRPG